MRCVNCETIMRSSYVGDGKRALRGDYCFRCMMLNKQKNKKVIV